jgi:outer membrane murein-binding lipoprotein Lpp
MKKTLFTLAAAVCITGAMLAGCQSSADKVKDAEEKVQDANDQVDIAKQELDQALKDSIQQFRKESEAALNENEKSIAAYKVKIAKEKSNFRTRDEQRLAELERQNLNMRRDLNNFNDAQKDKWDSFRARFKSDMENHAKAMRDFWSGGK